MWPLTVPPLLLLLPLLCSGLAGQVGAGGQVRAQGRWEGGAPRGSRTIGVHVCVPASRAATTTLLREGFTPDLPPGSPGFGGQSDLSFGVHSPLGDPHLAAAQWGGS